MPLPPGTRLATDEIVALLGTGGMGVYPWGTTTELTD